MNKCRQTDTDHTNKLILQNFSFSKFQPTTLSKTEFIPLSLDFDYGDFSRPGANVKKLFRL
jgi:hypothetical protein